MNGSIKDIIMEANFLNTLLLILIIMMLNIAYDMDKKIIILEDKIEKLTKLSEHNRK